MEGWDQTGENLIRFSDKLVNSSDYNAPGFQVTSYMHDLVGFISKAELKLNGQRYYSFCLQYL